MINLEYDTESRCGHIVLRPNQAASWRDNRTFLLVVTSVAVLVSSGFALMGAWLILPFAGLEVAALISLLWYVYSAHSRQEVVHFSEREIIVEQGKHQPEHIWRCQRPWCRFDLRRSHPWYPRQLKLCCHQREIEIGSFLNDDEREVLQHHLVDLMHRSPG
ncbi:MAG: DUF2244 domain-containing protein [Proteobacteria bacterium]|jgi:uncharacterized membrane protein|nr:DUF2244 domain-containing protein [Pseudomonadota bacterium]MCG6935392.1 DUF2244 domain-containing protein [Pseudomonadota bacterium]